jgi:hypothetical protein
VPNESTHRNDTGSWICVAVMIAAFIVGTVLFIARFWWGFTMSCLVLLAATLAALKVGIMQDTRTGRLEH